MWFFKKKLTVADSGLMEGFVDWHSHLLPGVDDGEQLVEASHETLSMMASMGVKHVVFTPHIMEDFPNKTADMKVEFDRYQAERGEVGKGVEISLGAENMLDNLFQRRFLRSDLLPIHKNNLLVETSYFSPPMDLEGVLSSILSAGYFPMLAHPERYRYMEADDYARLKSRGVKFQLNMPSLLGFYGRTAFEKSHKLLKLGYYDLVGLDIHSGLQYERFLAAVMPTKVIDGVRPLVEASNAAIEA